MKSQAKVVALIVGGLAVFPLGHSRAQDPAPSGSAHSIEGVPYVSWREAAGWDYPGHDVLNPAAMAATQMLYRYWGHDAPRKQDDDDPAFTIQGREGKSLAEIKELIDRGLPVLVARATTARAHRLYVTPKVCIALKNAKLKGLDRGSGSLGEMIPLEEIEVLHKADCLVGLDDSVIVAPQVVIGYDDARQVFRVHDPSLGPHLEVPYADLDRAWSAVGRHYGFRAPTDSSSRSPMIMAVRGRTVDDDAAVALFEGYAWEVTGDSARAVDVLRRGLKLSDLSP